MRIIAGHFDGLHSTESTFGPPRLEGSRLFVPARKLVLLVSHPLAREGWEACTGEMVFEGVMDSRRTLVEYIGDARAPSGFRPEYEVVDRAASAPLGDALAEFSFEGVLEAPLAWIDTWVVRAESFALHVPRDGQVSAYER